MCQWCFYTGNMSPCVQREMSRVKCQHVFASFSFFFFPSRDSIICVEVYGFFFCFCLFSHQMNSSWTTIAALHFETVSDHHPSHTPSVFNSSICFIFSPLSRLPTRFNAVNTEMGRVGSVCVDCTVCKRSSLESHAFSCSSTKKKGNPKIIFRTECLSIKFKSCSVLCRICPGFCWLSLGLVTVLPEKCCPLLHIPSLKIRTQHRHVPGFSSLRVSFAIHIFFSQAHFEADLSCLCRLLAF